jgi:hypothetical protein
MGARVRWGVGISARAPPWHNNMHANRYLYIEGRSHTATTDPLRPHNAADTSDCKQRWVCVRSKGGKGVHPSSTQRYRLDGLSIAPSLN